jgi:hypothetical protein
MKILINLIFIWMLALGAITNAQAFNNQDELDSSLVTIADDATQTFSLSKENDDLDALTFPLANNNITSLTPSLTDNSAPYQVGSMFSNEKFTAESGFSDKSTKQVVQTAFFLQGRYRLLQQAKFSLLITAKIESLNEHSIYQFYSNDFVSHEKSSIPVNASNAYARVGILGKYTINEHWSLVGGITSTAHEKSVSNQPIHQKKTDQVALFGTTYTF